ncbi:ATP-binding cassette domain-containing protein [Algivirga pacifica]|uniref:ABC transporter ATP-binding protein n=1 Tax=Algivirga pacifica TaxID=1162670 RepID=A0ABP9D288_9BACT
MIQLNNLQKEYKGKLVLDIPSLTLEKGELLGLVGNNGAGKTTLLSLVLDLIQPSQGEVLSNGIGVAMSEHWKVYTAAYLDENFLITHLTPMEYLRFVGRLHDLNKADVEAFLEREKGFMAEDLLYGTTMIRDLSKGNKVKVGILSVLLSSPALLVLDEPYVNLDPSSQAWLVKRLKKANEEGTTVLLSSHDLNHVAKLSTRIVLLEEGKVVEDMQTDDHLLDRLEQYFNV